MKKRIKEVLTWIFMIIMTLAFILLLLSIFKVI
jgi:hypothetical protein